MTSDPAKILSLNIEHVKKVEAFTLEPRANGLTVIGGNNRAGKSTILHSIAAGLGGKRFDPSKAVADGESKGSVEIGLSNGLTVTKTFTEKGSYLKVTDPDGEKSGQALLDEFISAFALDLGKFLHASDKKRAQILLEIIGVNLTPFEEKHSKLYADREAVGRLRSRAKKHAEAMPFDEEAGIELYEPSEIMDQLQEVMDHNARIRNLASDKDQLKQKIEDQNERIEEQKQKLHDARQNLAEMQESLSEIDEPGELKPDDQLRDKIAEIDELNARVRRNLDREKALGEAEGFSAEYGVLTDQIKQTDAEKMDLLIGAEMPLPGLSVESEVITYKEQPWDGMADSEQMIVAAAICKSINPKMGFVLIDRIESIDLPTLTAFGRWAKDNKLQVITTRVSTGEECTIVIEDGVVKGSTQSRKKNRTKAKKEKSSHVDKPESPSYNFD